MDGEAVTLCEGLSISCFSKEYREARLRFLELASARALIQTYLNENKGPLGEDLAVDCAWLDPEEADKVVVLVSATHGVEGFCGSGVQIEGARALRADHGLHAHSGLSWNDERAREIKLTLRRHFHLDSRSWKEMVLDRSRQVIRQAFAGLAGTPIAS
jgi:hypothetical protein